MDHLDVFHQSPRRSPSALYLNGSSVPVIGVLQFIHIHQIEIASDGLQVTIRMLQQFVYHPVHSRRDLMFITHIRFFLFHISCSPGHAVRRCLVKVQRAGRIAYAGRKSSFSCVAGDGSGIAASLSNVLRNAPISRSLLMGSMPWPSSGRA